MLGASLIPLFRQFPGEVRRISLLGFIANSSACATLAIKAKVEVREMVDSLMIMQAAASQIPQRTVIALIIVSALFVIGLLALLSMFVRRAPNNDPLKYGNFFVVALGITAAVIGYLEAAPIGGQLFAHDNSQRDCTAF